MEIITEVKENWKAEKAHLNNAISSLKKSMVDFKAEKKTEWKSFKNKFNDDIHTVEKSLKEIIIRHK